MSGIGKTRAAKAGELLRQMEEEGSRRRRGQSHVPGPEHESKPTLKRIGLTRKQSHQFQQLAPAEIKLRAERRAGDLLAVAPQHPGGRPSENPSRLARAKLADVGLTWSDSSRWQRIAGRPGAVE